MMNYPIFLIGFMASGKSSIGKKIAKKLAFEFVDLDQAIETFEGESISEIFENRGEQKFRELESYYLRKIPTNKKAIIALGGGTVCHSDNIDYINLIGTSIYLKRKTSRLLGRLRQNRMKRPLVAQLNDHQLKEFVEEMLAEREKFYQKAEFTFDADHQEINDLVALINT